MHSRDAGAYWKDQRQVDLNRAVTLAVSNPLGENAPGVINLRRWVATIDAAVAQRAMVLCKTGVMPNGDQVTPLVANSFMCSKWTGAQGASLARGAERINDLAEEVREKMDGTPGASHARLEELADGQGSGVHFSECSDPNCRGCA